MQDIFNRIRQTFLDSRLHNQTVHNNLDIMLDIFIQHDFLRQLIQVSVYAHTYVSALLCPFQNLLVSSFSPTHDRCQKLNLRSLRQLHDLIDHLIHCLLLDLLPALRAMGNTHSRIKETEIIIDLRHRSNCGTWISVRRFLVNGNGRRKSFNAFHIRLLHLSKKLSCIRRQRLHISSLSFRVYRIKCQRRLSRTTDTGKDDQFISRNIQIHIFQIMLIRTSYFNILLTIVFFCHSANLFFNSINLSRSSAAASKFSSAAAFFICFVTSLISFSSS